MAIMINSSCSFDPLAHEDIIWNALKLLPDDWYVFHSLHIYDPHVDDYDGKQEVEIDFIVLVPSKGCLVIEAKSGGVSFTTEATYYNGILVPPYTWIFYSGQPMNPFDQVHTAMYCLSKYIASKNLKEFVERENFYRCVWFQQIPGTTITSLPNRPEAPKDIILTADSLKNPEEAILKIIATESQRIPPKTDPWDLKDFRYVTQHVLAPAMSLCPTKNWEYDQNVEKLNAMLDEQAKVLDFLSEQKFAVISGAAGTGKTMIALKKAKMESEQGHKVLYLCYNSALCDYLKENYAISGMVDYYTIDKWACVLCKTKFADMGALVTRIRSMVDEGSFEYQAVIVDEAQDFGQEVADNGFVDVLSELHDAMVLTDGCFYAFYDKNQVVNSKKVPSFITNADCKLTLYRNCRNTRKIAETSFSQLNEKPRLVESAISGDAPALYFGGKDETFSTLSQAIKDLTKAGIKQIVVLTVKKFASTCLRDQIEGQTIKINNQVFPFYSCAQYKGLESDAIVLVDVTKEAFLDSREKLSFYVGTSRAKFKLSIVAEMSDADCEEACRSCLGDAFIESSDYRTELSLAVAATIQSEEELRN